jgi:hypothetical protein
MTWLIGCLLFTRQWKDNLPKRRKTLTTSFPLQESHFHCHLKFYKTYHSFSVTKDWENKHLQTLTVWFFMMWHCSRDKMKGKLQYWSTLCESSIEMRRYWLHCDVYLRGTAVEFSLRNCLPVLWFSFVPCDKCQCSQFEYF